MQIHFIQEFQDCGYFYQCTNLESLTELSKPGTNIAAYIGFDCTAKSLHAGSLMQIMILRLLQRHGHKPIVVIGSATTKIGDPTGKDEMRKILSDEELAENTAGIKHCLEKFIKFGDGPTDALIVDNSQWLEQLNYLEFLKNFGRGISVNKMLTQDSIKLRLEREQNLTFLEFNYMLFQAYDFYHLNQQYNCLLQIGGSDQWGNIISGVELVRKISKREVIGLTTPLLTTASGTKMGKSVGGAIWLHEDLLSPYEYFQYWRNVDDLDVLKFAKMFAEFSPTELQVFTQLNETNINEAKKQLAYRLTMLCHGQDNATAALTTAIQVFEHGNVAGGGLPEYELIRTEAEAGISAYELLTKYDLCESKSAARKFIRGGGWKLNDLKITDENYLITLANFKDAQHIKLSIGKKKHILIKLVNNI